MLRTNEIAFAVDLQQRAHRLLLWIRSQLDIHEFGATTPHDGLDDGAAALQWVTANWRRLPADCVPQRSRFAPFANLLASLLVTSFTITVEADQRPQPRWDCSCALCSRLVAGSHLRPRKVLPADRHRAHALKFDHVAALAAERGKQLGDAAIDALIDGEAFRRAIAMATWAEHLLRRSRGDNEGPAVFALWREFAWTPSGSPDPEFELDARSLFAAERALALHLDPSLRRVARIDEVLRDPISPGRVTLVLEPGGFDRMEALGVAIGDAVELRRPDGSVLREKITGTLLGGGRVDFTIGSALAPADVPPGTEIWLPSE